MSASPLTLDTLIEAVRAAHPDGDELVRLGDAVRVSQVVTEQADHLVGHFVDQARRAGHSWTAIGASMGVSKQAVQKRFVLGPDDEPRSPDAPLFERFTPRARRAIAAARVEAPRRGALEIGPADLLLGVAGVAGGLAAGALAAQGITEDRLRAALGAEPPAAGATDGDVAFGAQAKKAIQLSVREALTSGHNYVGTEHLLLALLAAEDDVTDAVLREVDLDMDAVRAWLADELRRRAGDRSP